MKTTLFGFLCGILLSIGTLCYGQTTTSYTTDELTAYLESYLADGGSDGTLEDLISSYTATRTTTDASCIEDIQAELLEFISEYETDYNNTFNEITGSIDADTTPAYTAEERADILAEYCDKEIELTMWDIRKIYKGSGLTEDEIFDEINDAGLKVLDIEKSYTFDLTDEDIQEIVDELAEEGITVDEKDLKDALRRLYKAGKKLTKEEIIAAIKSLDMDDPCFTDIVKALDDCWKEKNPDEESKYLDEEALKDKLAKLVKKDEARNKLKDLLDKLDKLNEKQKKFFEDLAKKFEELAKKMQDCLDFAQCPTDQQAGGDDEKPEDKSWIMMLIMLAMMLLPKLLGGGGQGGGSACG